MKVVILVILYMEREILIKNRKLMTFESCDNLTWFCLKIKIALNLTLLADLLSLQIILGIVMTDRIVFLGYFSTLDKVEV